MVNKNKNKLTEAELEILQLLWKHGSSTVRFINEQQNLGKDVGYTTTLKIMQIMAEKGILSVDKKSRQHVYTPTLDETETKGKLLDSFLTKTFSGSAMKMVMQALGNHKPSKEELDEIKDFISKMEKKSK